MRVANSVLSGSAVYPERTRKAATLFRSGVSKRVVLSDDGGNAGWSHLEERNPRFVELAKTELIRNGVPAESILILDKVVEGTKTEAEVFAETADRNRWRSVVIVTSAYHTKRAYSTFGKTLDTKNFSIGITYPARGEYTPHAATWWLTPQGWNYVAGEYLKSIYYWLFY